MSFMTFRLAEKVENIHEPTHLTGIGQTEVSGCHFKAEISLLPDKHEAIPLKAVIIDKITNDQLGFYLEMV